MCQRLSAVEAVSTGEYDNVGGVSLNPTYFKPCAYVLCLQIAKSDTFCIFLFVTKYRV